MTVRVYQSGTARPTLASFAAPIIGSKPRSRTRPGFLLASVAAAFLVGFLLGLMI